MSRRTDAVAHLARRAAALVLLKIFGVELAGGPRGGAAELVAAAGEF
jgi:hypothetical protein